MAERYLRHVENDAFLSCVVANGEDKAHFRRTRLAGWLCLGGQGAGLGGPEDVELFFDVGGDGEN
jgi:hypothetical protein